MEATAGGPGSRCAWLLLGLARAAATASVDLASASTAPSMATSVTTISDRPALPAGSMILRSGSAASDTAQEPGAIECPSDSAAIGGRPRSAHEAVAGHRIRRADADGKGGLARGLGGDRRRAP